MLKIAILAIGGASTLMLLLLALTAMVLGDGVVRVDFNRYHEGWFEVGAYTVVVLLYPWAVWQVIKREIP